MNVLIKELPHELPASSEERTCLVHGDYRIDNVIFDRDSNEIAAVLDWELSTLGDGLADLAYVRLLISCFALFKFDIYNCSFACPILFPPQALCCQEWLVLI